MTKKKSLVGYTRTDWIRFFRQPKGTIAIAIPAMYNFPKKSFYFDQYRKQKVRITIEEVK